MQEDSPGRACGSDAWAVGICLAEREDEGGGTRSLRVPCPSGSGGAGCLSSWPGVCGAIPASSAGRGGGRGLAGIRVPPSLVLPIPSSAELPLTTRSVELGLGAASWLISAGAPEGARTRRAAGTLPRGRQIPPHSAPVCGWQGARRPAGGTAACPPGPGSKPSPDADAEALAEPGAGSCPGYRAPS